MCTVWIKAIRFVMHWSLWFVCRNELVHDGAACTMGRPSLHVVFSTYAYYLLLNNAPPKKHVCPFLSAFAYHLNVDDTSHSWPGHMTSKTLPVTHTGRIVMLLKQLNWPRSEQQVLQSWKLPITTWYSPPPALSSQSDSAGLAACVRTYNRSHCSRHHGPYCVNVKTCCQNLLTLFRSKSNRPGNSWTCDAVYMSNICCKVRVEHTNTSYVNTNIEQKVFVCSRPVKFLC